MQKKYFYIICACLTTILVFSLAASCSFCGISMSEKKVVDEELEEDANLEEDNSSQNGSSGSTATEGQDGSENESGQDEGEDTEGGAEEPEADEGEDIEDAEEEADEDDEVFWEEPVEEDEETLPEPEPEEEEEPAVAGETLRGIGVNTSISGQVAEDRSVFLARDSSGAPSIYVGDTASALLVKGFLSFDISAIDGDNILDTWLNLPADRTGNPSSLMGIFSVNYTNYGNTLEGDDWGRSSSAVFSSSLSNTDFGFTNDALKNAVQNALDEGRQYFQVKLSTQNANGNGTADGFVFMASDIGLEVSYN